MARAYLKGLPQLKARLVKLKEATRDPVRDCLAKGADMIVSLMKTRAKWKHVRDTIDWSWGLIGPKFSRRIASGAVGDIAITIHVGNTNVRDSQWLESGVRPHGWKTRKGQHPGLPPQPFFYVSYRQLKSTVQRMLRKVIKEAVAIAAKQ